MIILGALVSVFFLGAAFGVTLVALLGAAERE